MKEPLTTNQPNGNAAKPDTLTTTPSRDSSAALTPPPDSRQAIRTEAFDQPVLLQQTSLWSRSIVWGIVGVTTFVVAWACLAKIEEAIPATGKLEPRGAVQEVQAPVGGVIEDILVEEGQRVEQGQVLVRLDPTAAQAQRESLEQIRASLLQENRFYRTQLGGLSAPTAGEAAQLDLSPEIFSLTASRVALAAENDLYRAQLQGSTGGTNLTAAQLQRLQAIRAESDSRMDAAQLEVAQLERQLSQTQVQLASARENLDIDQSILDDITPLVEEGGLARLQYVRQQQSVLNSRTEVERLDQEQERIRLAIAQAQEQLQNTMAVSQTDMLNRMAENDKRIAEIDSQINRAIVENEKQLAEINSQLSQTDLNLRYQELRAPVDGTVFDLQAQMQGVVSNSAVPVMKIVPNEALIARVYITNQDIGFVERDMQVDVRVDSFPFSEFGDIQGRIVQIGSDALPPTEIRPFYHFPAEIEMDHQHINVNGREISLQSGMSISANIKVRQRTVISIFTDLFARKAESLTNTR